MLFGFLQGLFQIFLILSMIELVFEIRAVSISHMPIVDLDSAWTNDNVHRFSKFSQISNSSCKSKKNRLNNIFVQFTRCCNWNRVAIYHIEAFLVNGMLTFRFGYFLLSRISQQQLLQLFVRNETRPYFMVVHSFFSLIR